MVFLLTAEREQLCLSLTLPVASAAPLLFPYPWSLSTGIKGFGSPVAASNNKNKSVSFVCFFFRLELIRANVSRHPILVRSSEKEIGSKVEQEAIRGEQAR